MSWTPVQKREAAVQVYEAFFGKHEPAAKAAMTWAEAEPDSPWAKANPNVFALIEVVCQLNEAARGVSEVCKMPLAARDLVRQLAFKCVEACGVSQ